MILHFASKTNFGIIVNKIFISALFFQNHVWNEKVLSLLIVRNVMKKKTIKKKNLDKLTEAERLLVGLW